MTPVDDGPVATRWHLALAISGLGAFVVALAAGAWLFVFELARPVATASPWAIAANAGLFGAFALHHSVMARPWAKALLVRYVPQHLERSTFVWVASVLFLTVCLMWSPVAGVAWTLDGVSRWVGYAVQAAGLGVTLHSAGVLDLWDLAGVRQVQEAQPGHVSPPCEPAAGLTRRGAYGWVRHPIYFGWLLMTFPAPNMTAGRLVFAAITTAYLALAIPWEERSLLACHGEAYRQYVRDVRWRMIPGIY